MLDVWLFESFARLTMTPSSISFQYRFHAAGQGLFASGTFDTLSPADPFHWVFDCGSVSFKSVLRPVVSRYRSLVIGDHLDLLCISHFDFDHVSGLTDLLRGLHVETVLIPYHSKLERLLLGARKSNPSASYLAFLSDPIAFLLDRAASVGRFIVVGGPEQDDRDLPVPARPPEEPTDDSPSEIERRWRETSWHLKIVEGRHLAPGRVVDSETLEKASNVGTSIEAFFGSIETLAVNQHAPSGWEFLFFHKPIDPDVRSALLKEVHKIFEATLRKSPRRSLAELLASKTARDRVKEAFKRVLRGKDDINSTSLCVYTGPLLIQLQHSWLAPPWPDSLMARPRPSHFWHQPEPWNCSALYTGDANLKPTENREELRDFLTLERWAQVSVLQVPHHGSKNNWETGAAAEFANSFSIFCANDNGNYGHPDREVLLDLMYRGPHLVNKIHSWTVTGSAYFSGT